MFYISENIFFYENSIIFSCICQKKFVPLRAELNETTVLFNKSHIDVLVKRLLTHVLRFKTLQLL